MWPDKDLIHFLSPIHSYYVSFPYCTNCSSGSSLWQRNICENPSFSSFGSVMSSLSIHLLLGSWQLYLFCRSVIILAGMGWAALFLPSTPDSLFSLGAELLWSSLGWRFSLSRSILELYLCSWRLQLLRAIGYAFALSRYEVNGQLSSSLAEAPSAVIKIACHLSVWRKG